MTYRLVPTASMRGEVTRVAEESLDDALVRLRGLVDASPDEIEDAVHEVRTRCKELRGLARLVGPALGDELRQFDRTIRDATGQLSSLRDAHVMAATVEGLVMASGHNGEGLAAACSRETSAADDSTRAISDGDTRIREAQELLATARGRVERWGLPSGFEPLAAGLEQTYRRGQRRLARARRKPTADRLHKWRRSVEDLWQQLRLLEGCAPSMISPLVDQLDELADALGDHHDLSVLAAELAAEPDRVGEEDTAHAAVRLARGKQETLCVWSLRVGATVYGEHPEAFVSRIEKYWETAISLGPELNTGGIAPRPKQAHHTEIRLPGTAVGAQRRFLVVELPDLPTPGTMLRQGYLALDGPVCVRVRNADNDGSSTLTVTAGTGAARTELAWRIDREQFEVMWELTRGRRVRKTRYRVPVDEHVIELDVFFDHLYGLMVAEIEFASDEALAAFQPPGWLGRDVTDDLRYTNASLAAEGLHPALFG